MVPIARTRRFACLHPNPHPPDLTATQIREHPKKGFYVDGLNVVPVQSFKEIEDQMEAVGGLPVLCVR